MKSAGSSAARDLRKELGLPKEPIDDLRGLLRRRKDIALVERPLSIDIDGAYAYDKQLDIGFIYLNARPIWTRRRFTMAHELGHHLLQHRDRVDKSVDDLYDSAEIDANAFAAELLMPAAGIFEAPRVYDAEDVGELAGYYMVSGVAMIHRLSDLKIIDNAAKKRLLSSYDASYYARFVTARPPDAEDTARAALPPEFEDAVFDLYRRGEITLEAMQEALDLTEGEISELLPATKDGDRSSAVQTGVSYREIVRRRI